MTSVIRVPRIPKCLNEKLLIEQLQCKNHPILTSYIVYDKLVEGDYILCVNPATSEFVIYDIKLEMYDNYKSLRRKLDELYTEKKYLIYLIK
jgi:hypothetical protein